jgi:flavin reductase (DIM6/NTAB) family NADH-FMN oxidoreductase RutF
MITEDPRPTLDKQFLKHAYGAFLTGVTVLTTVDEQGTKWGMTASSFNSISLEPPLISISIGDHTPSHSAFTNCTEFGVSILAVDQTHIARQFATRADDKFAGAPIANTPHDTPVLDGGAAWLICRPKQVLEVGDHSVIIAEVVACDVSDQEPLAYHRGTFFSLADQVKDELAHLKQRQSTVGFIVEYEDKIALVPDGTSSTGGWTLPMGRLTGGTTTAEALRATASRLLKAAVEPDFLYSTIDIGDNSTCSIYRGHLRHGPEQESNISWFSEDDVPWAEISAGPVEVLVRRYLRERVSDQFGIYVSVGDGRIAKITKEAAWQPS